MKIITTYVRELNAKIRLLPTDLKWLFWFSVPVFCVSTISLIFAREQLYEKIIPYTGWSPGFVYWVLAIIALQSTSKEKNDNLPVNSIKSRYKIVCLLGVYLIFGLVEWIDNTPEYFTHSNPYLRYEPLRIIYSIFLPLFWILIIGWPLAKTFLKKQLKA